MNTIKCFLSNLFNKTLSGNDNYPFMFVLRTPPPVLYKLINTERNQTIAFILSFWKHKRYIRDFLDLLVKDGKDATKEFIVGYLKKCPDTYSVENAREIERVLEKEIAAFSNEELYKRKKQYK